MSMNRELRGEQQQEQQQSRTIRSWLVRLRDDEGKAEREASKAEAKIKRITDRDEREKRRDALRLAKIKRKIEIAEAREKLNKALEGKHGSATALNEARKVHARSLMSWVRVPLPSRASVQRAEAKVRKTAPKVARTAERAFDRFLESEVLGTKKPRGKRTTARKKTASARK